MSQAKKKFNGRMISGVVIAIVALIIIVQNTASAEIKFLGWSWNMPIWLILVIMFVLGMLLGGAVRSGVRKLRGAEPKKS
ncbi:MAG: LapA family protein [Candidatus Nanopelagicales bacterium]|nr:LapA family protein [Candidatus Nanopelagicales bacterium]